MRVSQFNSSKQSIAHNLIKGPKVDTKRSDLQLHFVIKLTTPVLPESIIIVAPGDVIPENHTIHLRGYCR